MSHFAKVENGIVTQVLVIEQDQIDTGNWGNPADWIQTSYNTRGNVHYLPDSHTPSGQPAVRGNYAGVGAIYDATHDVFYRAQPFPSWTLDTTTWQWRAPVAKPAIVPFQVNNDTRELVAGTDYDWDESSQAWVAYATPRG
jgi:hypothetical protein